MGTLAQHFEEQGLRKGIHQGMQRGTEKGTLTTTKKIVNNMLKERIPLKLICKLTGLSDDELQNLRSKKDLKTKKLHHAKTKGIKTKKQSKEISKRS